MLEILLSYDIKIILNYHFWSEGFVIWVMLKASFHIITGKSENH